MFRFKTSHLLLFPLLGLIPAQSFAANFCVAVSGGTFARYDKNGKKIYEGGEVDLFARVDPDQKGGKKIQITPDDLTTQGAAEAWMRQVQTTPADFLKLKFAIQAAAGAKP